MLCMGGRHFANLNDLECSRKFGGFRHLHDGRLAAMVLIIVILGMPGL